MNELATSSIESLLIEASKYLWPVDEDLSNEVVSGVWTIYGNRMYGDFVVFRKIGGQWLAISGRHCNRDFVISSN